jgi:hypothetical protein
MSRRCFVIAPIGEPGSSIREHSDDVFRFIIEPAMRECGIEAFRSDHLKDPGKITDQMFGRILGDDLCIAVVTGHNPNVFYEIAIAQAAGRPVILLAEQGELMPFDLADQRFVEYTMKPGALVDGVYAREVVAHVRSLEAADWTVAPPVEGLVQSPRSTDDELRFLAHAHDFGAADAWMEVFGETEGVFEIMGITLASWRKSPGFVEMVEDKAAAGCEIRMLVLHPDNPALPELINDSIEQDRLDEVREKLAASFRFFSRLAQASDRVSARQISRGCPHFQLARADQRATCIPYMYSRRSDLSPLVSCRAEHPLYATLAEEFADLWDANPEPG